MNKEEKHLLKYELIIDYYKDDITKLYRRRSDNTCFDNDILNNEDDVLYITTLNKYQKLQQENKRLKERIDKVIYNLEKSIESINKKLIKDKTTIEVKNGVIQNMNDYQIVRLKAIRMKCKELLEILKGE